MTMLLSRRNLPLILVHPLAALFYSLGYCPGVLLTKNTGEWQKLSPRRTMRWLTKQHPNVAKYMPLTVKRQAVKLS